MISSKTQIRLIAFALVLALSGAAFGQDGNAASQQQRENTTTQKQTVSDGKRFKTEGIVVRTTGNTFTLRTEDGTETEVVVVDKTSITISRGLFHRDRTTDASNILRGLRLKAKGRANSDGQLVAKSIDIDEQDFRTAQALASRVDPVETVATSAQNLAENNSQRIDGNDKRLDQAEQNAQRISGQVEELSSVASAAASAAQKAQTTADQAQADASTANERINSLDDYEVAGTLTVHFKSGSAGLSPRAKAEIDEVANSVSDLKGWVLAVTGYADSRGKSTANRSLSDRRAKAVIDYLITKHGLPLRRVIQPYGYGSMDPVARNNTREGRALNRRAEIAILVNKGISAQAGSQQSGDQLSRRP